MHRILAEIVASPSLPPPSDSPEGNGQLLQQEGTGMLLGNANGVRPQGKEEAHCVFWTGISASMSPLEADCFLSPQFLICPIHFSRDRIP